MKVSQKTKVVAQYLVPIAVAYFAIGTFLFTGTAPRATELPRYLGGMAGLVLVGALVQDLVPKPFKEWLVFWRLKDRLPGHRAFTEEFELPDRFDSKKIKNWSTNGSLSPKERQQIFYQIYRSHDKEIRVEHYSFRYLAWRDSASMLLLLSIATVPALGLGHSYAFIIPSIKLSATMTVCFLCATLAARQSAHELVVQVFTSASMKVKKK